MLICTQIAMYGQFYHIFNHMQYSRKSRTYANNDCVILTTPEKSITFATPLQEYEAEQTADK